MIIVTGGAGFIGSNLVHALAERGEDVLVVDDLTRGEKFVNLVGAKLHDYLDKRAFLERARADDLPAKRVDAVFHQGACAVTTEWDGRYMMDNNYEYSKVLLDWCHRHRVPFIYASSAAVYGLGPEFHEEAPTRPLNVYGYSKLLFDEYWLARGADWRCPIFGLRYFNVYGPREQHKGGMASVAWHLHNQLAEDGRLRLFEGSDGYGDGEQRRDFVHVLDAVRVNLWCAEQPDSSGIYNVGTGQARSFNALAKAMISHFGKGEIEYIPFPDHLRGRYQSFTEADVSRLREAGYDRDFISLEDGVAAYMKWLAGPSEAS